MNPLDLVILGILLLAGLRGLKRGLFGSLAGLLGYLGAYWFAWKYRHIAAERLESNFHISRYLEQWMQNQMAREAWAASPSPVPPVENISTVLVLAAGFLLTFMLVRLVLALVGGLISAFVQTLPVLGGLDKLGGALIGALEGVLLAGFLLLVLALGQPFLGVPAMDRFLEDSLGMNTAQRAIELAEPSLMRQWNEFTQAWMTL